MSLTEDHATRIKRIASLFLMFVFIIEAVSSIVIQANATNTSIIGTNTALGSPVLSSEFTTDDWNKWEMITWGIFLSNFATPLLDDYQSAFDSSSTTGSKGSGYKALQFGSGNDASTNENIKGLLQYAVTEQKSVPGKQIYVSFSNLSRSGAVSDGGDVRAATLKDLFLGISNSDTSSSWVKLEDYSGALIHNSPVVVDGSKEHGSLFSNGDYLDIATINEGKLPTFSVLYNSNNYETVFDYANSWDIQVMTAWFSRTVCGDHAKDFCKLFDEIWKDAGNYKLILDCFGNICINYQGSNRIVIPASANQHLTSTPKINLLTSLIFDGYNSGSSNKDLVLQGQQSVSGWFGTKALTDVRYGGLPAFGSYNSSVDPGSIYFYYDLDTLAYQNHFNGGDMSKGEIESANDKGKSYQLNYGKAVKTLFDLDIDNTNSSSYAFKIEAAGIENMDIDSLFSNKDAENAIKRLVTASGQVANIIGKSSSTSVLHTLKTTTGDVELFDDSVVVPIQMTAGGTVSKTNVAGMGRNYINYLYDTYQKGSGSYSNYVEINKSSVEALLNNSSTTGKFKENAFGKSSDKLNSMLLGFLADTTNSSNISFLVNKTSLTNSTFENSGSSIFDKLSNVKLDGKQAMKANYDISKNLDYFGGRLIKAYPISSVMKLVGNYLGIRDGTDFGVYSTYVYMTYLNWYGVTSNTYGKDSQSQFNTKIFDGNSDVLKTDITTIISSKSKEDKEKDILNYTYLMLDPVNGREYRSNIVNSVLSDWVYNSYEKLVYGNSSEYYSSNNNNLATRNAAGFLNFDSYESNFMTSWFMSIYAKVAVVIIGISFVLIVIIGLIKGRKFSWFLVALVVVINTVLLVPSVGDAIPMAMNNIVQKMFSSKMTYWAISESVQNQELESDYVGDTIKGDTGLTGAELTKALGLIKSLNTVYLDRSLMIKKDISSKITSTNLSNYSDIQQLKSTRWMLPMIMRQFSADDNSADYVYTTLGDMYDNVSNMYWYYVPIDAASTSTVNGASTNFTAGESLSESSRTQYYADYTDTTSNDDPDIAYRSEAYTLHNSKLDEMPHTYFYILTDVNNLLRRYDGFDGEYKDSDSFQNYVTKSLKNSSIKDSFEKASSNIQEVAGSYNSSDRSTVAPSFGYLWSTENPYHYFYESVKDSFSTDISLANLVGQLQGQYISLDDGSEVRTNFMYSGQTGKIKDVADLEELITNMVPYLYEMQITAGGFDGTSGVLGTEKLSNYKIYKNNYASWLFRSNWATKLMECSSYTDACKVADKSGKEYTVLNPMLSECYPTNRPMVFSEAQQYAEGLSDSDLSLVELKCVEINKDIARRWTMLINYAGTSNITKEVFYRQMATEAILAFNSEFSPSGILNTSYEMYPNGIDLRAISFDSVMKMLMLNVTKDTSYIYGDTMANLIEKSDMIMAAFLLLSAFLCAYIIPLARNIVMGLIFYLGFIAVVYTLVANTKKRAKVSGGYLISNIIFMVITVLYYGLFDALMAVTSSDSVLTVQSVQINIGNPVWCYIFIIFISCVYIYCLGKMINFCFKHYRDMGFEVYATLASDITDKIANRMDRLGDKFTGSESGRTVDGSGNISGENNTTVNYSDSSSSNNSNIDESQSFSSGGDEFDEGQSASYSSSDSVKSTDNFSIDSEIEKGKQTEKSKSDDKSTQGHDADSY